MAVELYASLILQTCILTRIDKDQAVGVFIPYCTDNEGSAYCLLNETSKKWPSSVIVMEMLVQALAHNVQLAPTHVRREFNTWADSLVNSNFEGFDQGRRVRVDLQPPSWTVLDVLLTMGEK